MLPNKKNDKFKNSFEFFYNNLQSEFRKSILRLQKSSCLSADSVKTQQIQLNDTVARILIVILVSSL